MKALYNLGKWQNYVHYFINVFAIMLLLKYGFSIALSVKQFLILYVFMLVVDTLIHVTFTLLPKPWRWAD